jgi:hypothetical protein
MKVVLYPYNLYLDDVEFHPDLSVKTGRVINGGWDYESTEDTVLCWGYRKNSDSLPVSEYPRNKPEEYYVIVPFNYTEEITDFRDYMQVMTWADKQPPSIEEDLELALVLDSEYKALKKQEYDIIFDDDIPF